MNTKTLYRYRPITPYLFQEITSDRFHFSKSKELDDPFDLYPIVFDSTNNTSHLDCLRTSLKIQAITKNKEINIDKKYSGLIAELKAVAVSRDEFREVNGMNEEQFFRHLVFGEAAINLKELIQKCGIVCFSKTFDNYMMWSSYAESHKGVCIEYQLESSLSETSLYSVDYVKSLDLNLVFLNQILSDLESTKTLSRESLSHLFCRKLDLWEPQNEWRLVHFDNPSREVPSNIKKIFFGVNTTWENQNSVMSVAKKTIDEVTFSEIELSHGKNSLIERKVPKEQAAEHAQYRSGLESHRRIRDLFESYCKNLPKRQESQNL